MQTIKIEFEKKEGRVVCTASAPLTANAQDVLDVLANAHESYNRFFKMYPKKVRPILTLADLSEKANQ